MVSHLSSSRKKKRLAVVVIIISGESVPEGWPASLAMLFREVFLQSIGENMSKVADRAASQARTVRSTCLDHLLAVLLVTSILFNNRLSRHPTSLGAKFWGPTMSHIMRDSTCDRALGMRLWRHGTSRPVCSIKRRATPAAALVRAPTRLAREDSVVEAVKGAGTCAINKGRVAEEGDMIKAKVPDRSIDHAVRGEGHDGSDEGACEDIVPAGEVVNSCAKRDVADLLVVFVNGEGTADETGTENRSVNSNELPHGRVVVGPDLQLGVQVEIQKDEAGKCSGGVTRWHGL